MSRSAVERFDENSIVDSNGDVKPLSDFVDVDGNLQDAPDERLVEPHTVPSDRMIHAAADAAARGMDGAVNPRFEGKSPAFVKQFKILEAAFVAAKAPGKGWGRIFVTTEAGDKLNPAEYIAVHVSPLLVSGELTKQEYQEMLEEFGTYQDPSEVKIVEPEEEVPEGGCDCDCAGCTDYDRHCRNRNRGCKK